ncbi:activating signal cointegrator 1 complex subunit 1-like [Acanthaster planci]|uniref:Activating signal cointegrator 1 complex subunit 1-like n=1 Tax=Acanthaster planci TaxID=133434 RepID=A0A8B7YRI0_ACAPL|nr:activating signal cointegrator 1 complex subunit 1-like [Acanthaster planci]XP_022095064.1 activating signal cointegrator 1 complex subunit 1-like [Acanthaster planci]XP_022095065.1 activating signal cointegrator 1 complex subunit 1-like [Acanthaster planci]XP_022095067.1 activating signal cointegrator 1 complex subunit 1-like [Acanthaster planci]
MDILKPPIIRIDGRCYRQNPVQKPAECAEPEDDDMEGYGDEYDEHRMEECCDLDIRKTDKGYSLTMEVPNGFFGLIIGRQGETRKRIEQETKTRILIPNKAQKEEDEIVIHGEQRPGIISAKTRIDVIVSSARQKTAFTHLMTLPFNSQPLQDRFQEFKEDVLRNSRGDESLDESLFQKPAKLHLTVGTMVLMSKKEVAQAQELLEKCKEEIIQPLLKDSFLLVKLEGLEYMNDDPGKVDVLYGKAIMKDGSNKLQVICDSLMNRFVSAGLMQQDYDRVKIHITLINTLFRREPDAEDGSKRTKGRRDGRAEKVREAFNAKRILKNFGEYFFGDCLISSIHISQRGSYGKDGYYLPVASVPVP